MVDYSVSNYKQLNISFDEWISLLENKETFDGKAIKLIKAIYSFENHAGSLNELNKITNLNVEDMVSTIGGTESNIKNYLGIENLTPTDENPIYCMFVLNNGYYQLRKNLIDAMDSFFNDFDVKYNQHEDFPKK